MKDDPIVNEVRQAREAVAARFGYDLQKYLSYLSEQERKHPARVVGLEEWKRRRSVARAAAPSTKQE